MPPAEKSELGLPKSQNAEQTRGSAPLKMAESRALYMAHEDAGEPGKGNMLAMEASVLAEAGHLSENESCNQSARAVNRQA